MGSVEKARLKVEIVKSVEENVAEAASNSEKNVIGLSAARDIVGQLHRRFVDYAKSIDSALIDGTIPATSAEFVRAVHSDLTSVVESAHKELGKAVETQSAFTGGLKKAAAVVAARVRVEEQAVQAAEVEVREDERERAAWAAREAERAEHERQRIEAEAAASGTQAAVARIETEAAEALLASLPPDKPKRKRSGK